MSLEFAGRSDSDLLMVGAGRAVITPPAGYPICGPEHPERRSCGVADDLLAKVFVIESAGERAALVGLDAWAISENLRRVITGRVSEEADVPAENVWVSVTGNGTSPCLWRKHPDFDRYSRYLPDMVAGAAVTASTSLEPASIVAGASRLPDLSTSVEGPGRPGDDALFVVGFDNATGDAIGRLVNFSCPATIMGPGHEWTADYPGYATWAMEQGGGGLSIFAQGACADIRPFDWYAGNTNVSHAMRGPADVQAFGLLLATQSARATDDAVPRRNAPIASASDAESGLHVLRIGMAVFIAVRPAQPARFARHIRRDLPGSTVFVSANQCGDSFDTVPELDEELQRRAVELARTTGAR